MAAPEMTLENLEIIHPRTYVENGYPHEAFRILRNEAPVYWYTNTEAQPFWAITKHADIMHIGKNPQIFANAPELIVPFEPRKDGDFNPPPTLIQMDNPDHSEFRKIISRRFTPRALKKIMHDIDRIASKIIDSLLEEGDEGECDFVEKVSAPLPIAVIAWLLGVPEEDWTLLFDWTNRTIGAGDPEYQKEGEDSNATAQAAMAELFTYFAALVEERRKNPTDDLITLFTQAEVYGRKLDPMEVITYCFIIVVAGNETTRNGTTGGMLAFIEHQDQMRKLQQDPSLLKSSVEEIVRWTSPIIQFARTAMEDTEVRGVPIKKGELVGLFYPSANRDEEVFDRPYEFDITRRPNRHLGFGTGEHFCVGAHVARLEMEMAYRTLIPRIAEIELTGPPERLYSNLVGGVKHLPIRYKLHPA